MKTVRGLVAATAVMMLSSVGWAEAKPQATTPPGRTSGEAATRVTTTATPADVGPLADMAWFIGNWKTEIKAQNGNPALTVDAEMKWSENHRAIVFQVWFTSEGKREAHYFGMYAWDPGEKTLKMWQVANDGNLSVGRAKTEGKRFTQVNHLVRANGTTQEQQTEIVRDGEDAYDWKVQIEKDGQWVDALKLRYERVKSMAKTGGMQ